MCLSCSEQSESRVFSTSGVAASAKSMLNVLDDAVFAGVGVEADDPEALVVY
jgi:hypothetical protein